ncbi:hypothetical protein cyc_04458 [Cyclospora cayetanensis]|uniref:Uncharacterized protein n=1 Tax=Cyclospora cayetanensis TaxID=88456 RepID=A0A1D3D8F3_9EIME|nr:hypothetical protein cyc_04458 [Cyclospora cayetanensis]
MALRQKGTLGVLWCVSLQRGALRESGRVDVFFSTPSCINSTRRSSSSAKYVAFRESVPGQAVSPVGRIRLSAGNSSHLARQIHHAASSRVDPAPSSSDSHQISRQGDTSPVDPVASTATVSAVEAESNKALAHSRRVLKKPIPPNFVSDTFLPHLEHQIIHMAPSFSVLQLGEVGGAYAKLPEALRDKEVEKVLLEHVRKNLKHVHTSEEAMAVVSLMELLWAGGSANLSPDGNPPETRKDGVLSWLVVGSGRTRRVEADLFVSLKEKTEAEPALLSGLSALNLFSFIRAYTKALADPNAFRKHERESLETFVKQLRRRTDAMLKAHDPQELISIIASIATYGGTATPSPMPPTPQQQQQQRHMQQQQHSEEAQHLLNTENMQQLLSRNPHLAVLPHVLQQVDGHLKRDGFSFFQLFQLLHLLQKCGIRHQGILEECEYFLHNGTYTPKAHSEEPPREQPLNRQQHQQLQQESVLEVDAEALRKMNVTEVSQFIQALDVLPPSLLAKIAWCFNQFGEFHRVERVLERPGAPVLQLICNRLATTASGMRPFEFLFFVVGALRLGRLYTAELMGSAELAPGDQLQLRDSYVDLRPLIRQFFSEKIDGFSPSQINYLLCAIHKTAASQEHADCVLELLPQEWRNPQQGPQRKHETK